MAIEWLMSKAAEYLASPGTFGEYKAVATFTKRELAILGALLIGGGTSALVDMLVDGEIPIQRDSILFYNTNT